MKNKIRKILCVVLSVCLMVVSTVFSVLAETYMEDVVIAGDANHDGWIDARDALLILQHSVKLIELSLSRVVDVDLNDTIDSEDALSILQFSVGICPPENNALSDIGVDLQELRREANKILTEKGYDVGDFVWSRSGGIGSSAKKITLTYQYYIEEIPTSEKVVLRFEVAEDRSVDWVEIADENYGAFSQYVDSAPTQADYERLVTSLNNTITEFREGKRNFRTSGDMFWVKDEIGICLCTQVYYLSVRGSGETEAYMGIMTQLYSEPL